MPRSVKDAKQLKAFKKYLKEEGLAKVLAEYDSSIFTFVAPHEGGLSLYNKEVIQLIARQCLNEKSYESLFPICLAKVLEIENPAPKYAILNNFLRIILTVVNDEYYSTFKNSLENYQEKDRLLGKVLPFMLSQKYNEEVIGNGGGAEEKLRRQHRDRFIFNLLEGDDRELYLYPDVAFDLAGNFCYNSLGRLIKDRKRLELIDANIKLQRDESSKYYGRNLLSVAIENGDYLAADLIMQKMSEVMSGEECKKMLKAPQYSSKNSPHPSQKYHLLELLVPSRNVENAKNYLAFYRVLKELLLHRSFQFTDKKCSNRSLEALRTAMVDFKSDPDPSTGFTDFQRFLSAANQHINSAESFLVVIAACEARGICAASVLINERFKISKDPHSKACMTSALEIKNPVTRLEMTKLLLELGAIIDPRDVLRNIDNITTDIANAFIKKGFEISSVICNELARAGETDDFVFDEVNLKKYFEFFKTHFPGELNKAIINFIETFEHDDIGLLKIESEESSNHPQIMLLINKEILTWDDIFKASVDNLNDYGINLCLYKGRYDCNVAREYINGLKNIGGQEVKQEERDYLLSITGLFEEEREKEGALTVADKDESKHDIAMPAPQLPGKALQNEAAQLTKKQQKALERKAQEEKDKELIKEIKRQEQEKREAAKAAKRAQQLAQEEENRQKKAQILKKAEEKRLQLQKEQELKAQLDKTLEEKESQRKREAEAVQQQETENQAQHFLTEIDDSKNKFKEILQKRLQIELKAEAFQQQETENQVPLFLTEINDSKNKFDPGKNQDSLLSYHQLHAKIKNRDLLGFQEILQANIAKLNAQQGLDLLQLAIETEQFEASNSMIALGILPNREMLPAPEQQTLKIIANSLLDNKKFQALKDLELASVFPNERCVETIMKYLYAKDYDSLLSLREIGFDFNLTYKDKPLIFYAAGTYNEEILALFLQNSTTQNQQFTTEKGFSILHGLAIGDNPQLINLYLKNKSNLSIINHKSADGNTPLGAAIITSKNPIAVCQSLLAHGADIFDVGNSPEINCLHLVSLNENLDDAGKEKLGEFLEKELVKKARTLIDRQDSEGMREFENKFFPDSQGKMRFLKLLTEPPANSPQPTAHGRASPATDFTVAQDL